MHHRALAEFNIYFANLAAYNAGKLVGGWVDVCDYNDEDELLEAIKTATENAEEWAVHDVEGPRCGIGEHSGTEQILAVVHSMEEYGVSFTEVVVGLCNDRMTAETFDEWHAVCHGSFEDISDWAYEYENDSGDLPERLIPYIDFEALGNAQLADYTHGQSSDGTHWIFS